ncbi:DNA cytosine methyltransferase [Kitasatospora purpeofusca]|uniref:DNA cytosine methyltransferase n=1 Tax=Kitasatospora purpeofusca TaxID=67352 RepID=UPI002A5AE7D1|nr:DNA cytosine methyltransferase [Kitasatospora purpeofusca]MDY0810112.1 DNA cytosine methyltransferase [Kitasatospora purpeofusca]
MGRTTHGGGALGSRRFTSLEICSGVGAQALGLERAGFDPVMLIDNEDNACRTVRLNRPHWDVRCEDVVDFDPEDHPQTYDVDLLSGGLPRIKSAAAGRSGSDRERTILRAAVLLTTAVRPRALMLENLPDLFAKDAFAEDRSWIEEVLAHAGYRWYWTVLNAVHFGVPQNRRSSFLVAFADRGGVDFSWPRPIDCPPPTVGQALGASMASRGWTGAEQWSERADRPAPALVGGSGNHGGPDLGPTGTKRAWAALGVEGKSLSNNPPDADFPFDGRPRISLRQAATLQAIPDEWIVHGLKTPAYRQIGHALPPPLAEAVGGSIAAVLAG